MAQVGSLLVKLGLDSQRYTKGMKDATTRMGKLAQGTKSLGSGLINLKRIAIGAFIGWGVSRVVGDVVRLAAVQEDAEKAMAAALESTGRLTKKYDTLSAAVADRDGLTQHFLELGSAIQKETKYGDEAVLGASALLTQLTKLKTEGLDEATKGAVGLASVYKTDLQAAATLVGKALAGNYGALSRYGIMVEKTMTDEEKRASILKQLAVFYKRAQAETNTFAGAQAQLANVYGDLKEKIGDVIVKNKVFVDIMHDVRDWLIEAGEKTVVWTEANKDLIAVKVHEYLEKIKVSIEAIVKIYNALPVQAVSAGLIMAILFRSSAHAAILVAALTYVATHLDDLKWSIDKLGKVTGLKAVFQPWIDLFVKAGKELKWLVDDFKRLHDAAKLPEPEFHKLKIPKDVTESHKNTAKDLEALRKKIQFDIEVDNWLAWANAMIIADGAVVPLSSNTMELKNVIDSSTDSIKAGTEAYEAWLKKPPAFSVIRQEIVLLGRDIDTVWSDALDMVKGFASKAGAVLKGIWEGAGWIFKGGIATIKWLLELPGGFATAVKNFKESLENFPAMVDDFMAAVDQLPEVIDELIKRAPELIEAVIGKLPRIFTAIINAIPRVVTVFLQNIVPAFIAQIPTIVNAFLIRVPDIIQALVRGIPHVINAIMEGIPQIITNFIQNVPLIINSFINEFIRGIPDIISAFISNIPEIVKALVEAIADMVIPGGGKAKVTGIDIIPDIIPIIGPLFHKGGIVGQHLADRMVPAAAFAGASRAHAGLAPDERPIIVKKGEGVFTPEQMQALGARFKDRDQRPIHITLEISGRKLGTWFYEGTKSGAIQVHRRALESR